jgi:Phage capsid family
LASSSRRWLISDAKDVLEATAFLTGTGTNQPVGILTIGTTGALTTAQRVLTAGAGAVVVGDIYSLKQTLGSTRFAGDAVWTFHPNRLDAVFRFTPSGSTIEPQIMTDRNGPLLGRPTAEWSTMTTAVTTGSRVAIYADWKQAYVIGDRLGMQLEIVPHLFGATNRYPTGQRGGADGCAHGAGGGTGVIHRRRQGRGGVRPRGRHLPRLEPGTQATQAFVRAGVRVRADSRHTTGGLMAHGSHTCAVPRTRACSEVGVLVHARAPAPLSLED